MAPDNQMTDEGNEKIELHSERTCKTVVLSSAKDQLQPGSQENDDYNQIVSNTGYEVLKKLFKENER